MTNGDRTNSVNIPTIAIVAAMSIVSAWAMRSCDTQQGVEIDLVSRVVAAETYVAEHKVAAATRDKRLDEIHQHLQAADEKIHDVRERLVRIEATQGQQVNLLKQIAKEVD